MGVGEGGRLFHYSYGCLGRANGSGHTDNPACPPARLNPPLVRGRDQPHPVPRPAPTRNGQRGPPGLKQVNQEPYRYDFHPDQTLQFIPKRGTRMGPGVSTVQGSRPPEGRGNSAKNDGG